MNRISGSLFLSFVFFFSTSLASAQDANPDVEAFLRASRINKPEGRAYYYDMYWAMTDEQKACLHRFITAHRDSLDYMAYLHVHYSGEVRQLNKQPLGPKREMMREAQARCPI